MMLSSLRTKSKMQLHLYIVSIDRLFTKEFGRHNSLAVFNKVIETTSGEGLMKELSYNPVPPGTSVIVIVDFSLVDRDHPQSPNGLEVLAQLQESYRNFELILLLKPAEKTNKNTAFKMGIENVLIKNDNFFVRFEIALKEILNKLSLLRKERELRLLLMVFAAFTVISTLIIVIISLIER